MRNARYLTDGCVSVRGGLLLGAGRWSLARYPSSAAPAGPRHLLSLLLAAVRAAAHAGASASAPAAALSALGIRPLTGGGCGIARKCPPQT